MQSIVNKVCKWYVRLSNQLKDSVNISFIITGVTSSLFTILGISLAILEKLTFWQRFGLVISAFVIICAAIYLVLGVVFKSSITISIRGMSISICRGNIFECSGLKIIGCDTHFYTQVDDVVISKKSLHGQLVTEHGKKDEIDNIVRIEAQRLGLKINDNGTYNFPLGTIICYNSTVDNNKYLMLALTELDDCNRAHTDSVTYESTLIKMWEEIDRVYASNDVVLPLLGTGITRFRDGRKKDEAALRCMLCTLNNSGITLNSKIKILINSKNNDIALYEYKKLFPEASYGGL